jgi:hypothetical protein
MIMMMGVALQLVFIDTIISTTTGKKALMDPGASLSSSAGLWAARAPPPLTDWRNNSPPPPSGAFPYMRQHANTIAKVTVNGVFAAVPGLDAKLRARFSDPPPPNLILYQQAHKAAQAAQLTAHVNALQNPPPPDPTIVRAPPPSPDKCPRAWAGMQAESEAERAVQKAGDDPYMCLMARDGWCAPS